VRRSALLVLILLLAACGQAKLVTRTETIEVPHKQFVPMPAELTAPVPSPVAPSRACVTAGKTTHCNGQLVLLLDLYELALGAANDQLAGIRKLQAEAIKDPK